MGNSLRQPDLQLRTLRLYGELLCRRDNWSRQLVFAGFDGASGSGITAAASLAGAVSLVVDSDSANTKAHFRDGAFDFIVHTLDEALRAIKNEIRQGHSLAIGLMAEPAIALAEAAERGLVAACVLNDSNAVDEILYEPGAARIEMGQATPELVEWLSQRGWFAAEITGPGPDVAPDDRVRQTWLRDLPSHQRSVRQHPRWFWLTEAEAAKARASLN